MRLQVLPASNHTLLSLATTSCIFLVHIIQYLSIEIIQIVCPYCMSVVTDYSHPPAYGWDNTLSRTNRSSSCILSLIKVVPYFITNRSCSCILSPIEESSLFYHQSKLFLYFITNQSCLCILSLIEVVRVFYHQSKLFLYFITNQSCSCILSPIKVVRVFYH